jgi:monoterpene epsilon-lactone hydrolase
MVMANERQQSGARPPKHWQIRVRGPVGPTILEAFPTLTAQREERDTLLSGPLADQSALWGVLHLLEALGLELVGVCIDCGRT